MREDKNILGGATQFFNQLTPDLIEKVCTQRGLVTNAQVLALNSLENRVYQIGLEKELTGISDPYRSNQLIVKFYRPGRWSEKTIQEEHDFLFELQKESLPVIAPLILDNQSLWKDEQTQLLYAFFPKVQGRLKDELNSKEIRSIAKIVAQIHNIGLKSKFNHRPYFNPRNYLLNHLETFRADFIPSQIADYYCQLCQQIYDYIAPFFDKLPNQRIHGDLHRGNILWTSEGPFIVDFDDCSQGPAVQDLWLLIPGRDEQAWSERSLFLESYQLMAQQSTSLNGLTLEMLRSIRMIHFNGWIAKRWDDPTFKQCYPDFTNESFWQVQLLDLKEQISFMHENASGQFY